MQAISKRLKRNHNALAQYHKGTPGPVAAL